MQNHTDVDAVGLHVGSSLLGSLKQRVVNLASSSGVLPTIQVHISEKSCYVDFSLNCYSSTLHVDFHSLNNLEHISLGFYLICKEFVCNHVHH